MKNKELIKYAAIFTERESLPDVIFKNGIFLAYDTHRYSTFVKSTYLKIPVRLSILVQLGKIYIDCSTKFNYNKATLRTGDGR